MFANAISADTLRGIKILGKTGVLGQAYLAGGTALVLHLGHRISYDLDFFTEEVFEENAMAGKLGTVGEFVKDKVDWRTVLGTFEKMKFSIFYYQYPLVTETVQFEGVRVVQPPDIAAMKLLAISDRGMKRDFVDLYFMRSLFPLEQVFNWYGQKFGRLEERRYHLLRGLSYFEDADRDQQLHMIAPLDWDEVKRYFADEVKRLSRLWA